MAISGRVFQLYMLRTKNDIGLILDLQWGFLILSLCPLVLDTSMNSNMSFFSTASNPFMIWIPEFVYQCTYSYFSLSTALKSINYHLLLSEGSAFDDTPNTMRFRAKIFDVGTIEQFTRVVGTIAKLTQLCVLRITSDRMYFILNDKVSKGHLWCDLQALNLFSEFSMEGIAEDANEIYMEVNPDDLLRALKTAQTAKSVKIKLTKKFSPCLSLDVELPSRTGHSRTITHDIPVIVMPRRQWEEYSEPTLPDFDATICMPPLKVIRTVAERMKNLGSYLELSANQSGEMRLRVESEQVTVSTHFRNLENPDLDNANSQNSQRDPTDLVGARVDIRKFIHFLSGQQLNPAKIICSIVDNRVMHFFLLHEDLSIQYSMPIIFT